MSIDHEAIYKAYPSVVTIDDSKGAFDSEMNAVTLEQSKIDEARVELDKLKYKEDRAKSFASIGDQLDMQYWDAVNGTATWKDHIAKVKSDNPKPS
tara:strand:+ start:575 stop:862 length:288 start_codon:yes stop_codon:yes gene_type:complete